MATATQVQPKRYLKDVTLSFGLLSMTGSLFTPKRANAAKEESFKMACPLHPETPHGVKQRYVCEEAPDDEAFLPSDCLKARDTSDGLVIVPAEAVAAAKESDLPERTLELRAHPYEPASTFASGSAYIFQPDVAHQFYATLMEMVDEQGMIVTESGPKMLVGLVAYRKGTESFVRVERWGRQLVLRELIRPEDISQFEPIEVSVETKLLDMARQLVDVQAEPFNPEVYKASVRERIAQIVEAAQDGELDVTTLAPAKPKVVDMTALLEQSLQAAKAAKKGKRKAS